MSNPKLADLISTQELTAGLILRFWDNIKKLGQSNMTSSVLKTRLNTLDDYWKMFLARHFEIMRMDGAEKTEYALNDRFSVVEESRLATAAKIAEHLTPSAPSSRSSTSKTDANAETDEPASLYRQIQLAKIALPKFDGNQLAWENFRELFKSLVHDLPGIPDVQKLQHLRASLSGEAAELLHNVPMTEAGYSGAWADLVHRYDNSRIILHTHMRNLWSSPVANKCCPSELNRLLGASNQAIRAFKSLGRPVELWDDWFVHILVQRLDTDTRMLWETSLSDSRDFPSYQNLAKFLENRIRALEAANTTGIETRSAATKESHPTGSRKPRTPVNLTTVPPERTAPPCPSCKGNHSLGYCNRFKKLSPLKRKELVRQLNACSNCLRVEHTVEGCPSAHRCMLCSQKHHTFLHCPSTAGGRADPRTRATSSSDTERQDRPASEKTLLHTISTNSTVLLSTAQILVEAPNGRTLMVRALLDQGAEASFVSEWVAQTLKLQRQGVQRPIIGAQNVCTGVATAMVDVTVRSRRLPDCKIPLRALVLRTLTGASPASKVTLRPSWEHLSGLDLADPHCTTPLRIDAILGADIFGLLLETGLRKGTLESPTAQLTVFGWVLFGPTARRSDSTHADDVASLLCRDCSCTDEALRRFWEIEEVGGQTIPTAADEYCEDYYRDTHSRGEQGRYTVRLPFRKEDDLALGSSRHAAVKKLLQNERRLQKAADLRKKYANFMGEYADLGHMERVPDHEISAQRAHYLPHHAVTKAHDPLGKIRVVFDASWKTPSGNSLNDLLLPGPKLQTDLWLVLMRWRLVRVAFTTDIVKMFRQIRVHPDDADWQRIVWRTKPDERMIDYRLTTVTYRTSPAPFLAIRTLRQLAIDERHRYPLGAKALELHAYVDDLLVGADNEEGAKELKSQLTDILRAGGFELSKWATNCKGLITATDSGEKNFDADDGPRALGLRWNPCSDTFRLTVNLPGNRVADATKRSVLSTVASLYDPLGWAAPVLIFGKILMQNLWLRGLDWEQALPEDVARKWHHFCASLPDLEKLNVPRWTHSLSSNRSGMTLHGFCDASQRAYAAARYLRVAKSEKDVFVNLLVAKTKVAPVKTVSMPRLELCGAVLLARLVSSVSTGLDLKDIPMCAWTDSSVTLSWIHSHASRWKTFVANRVSEIHSTLPAALWRHVGTASNPADVATRGVTPLELIAADQWWHGPRWLTDPPSLWPESSPGSPVLGLEEERNQTTFLVVAPRDEDLLLRFSSLTRLLRETALCFRFAHNTRHSDVKRLGFLTVAELSHALHRWVGLAQQLDFAEDIAALKRDAPLMSRSRLRKLRPFLDNQGLLRVGGRLHGAFLPFEERHPLILAKSSHLSLLLVRDAHHATLHGGPQLTRSLLMRKYWIVQGASLIRSITRKCVRCIRYRMKTGFQTMGGLPTSRTTPARPFLTAGVDYAGPLQLRLSKGRGTKAYKGYICLFVCLASKAVHLEAVSDLTTAAFIAAFKRFVSRRGRCANLVSDNGSYFRGADKELAALFKAASHFYNETSGILARDGVVWKFIPPYAPHFGGLWEAGIKSVKYHLRRVIGEQKLTFEELSTLLCEIEACLNSRPLCPLSNDADDLTALTPGHLLIGEALTSVPEPGASPTPSSTLTRWQLLTNMRDHFWQRWSREYVHQLHAVTKWQTAKENLKEGTLVLLKEEMLPPSKWLMGRVVELHCGPDGLARAASLKTIKGIVKRPLVKICPLPIVAERPVQGGRSS